jgi:hypothetical protein
MHEHHGQTIESAKGAKKREEENPVNHELRSEASLDAERSRI